MSTVSESQNALTSEPKPMMMLAGHSLTPNFGNERNFQRQGKLMHPPAKQQQQQSVELLLLLKLPITVLAPFYTSCKYVNQIPVC